MRPAIVLLSILLLAGCTALVVGSGAGGGYQSGKDQRPPAVVTSDSEITNRVRAKFGADSTVSVFNIGIRTYEGKVTLTGTVGSYVARDQALNLARHTTGVKTVSNLIVVKE